MPPRSPCCGSQESSEPPGPPPPPPAGLRQPVVQRAPGAGQEAVRVGEESREEEDIGHVEGGGGQHPELPAPEEADVGAREQEGEDGSVAQVVLGGGSVALVVVEGEGLDAAGELGRRERADDDEDVADGRQALAAGGAAAGAAAGGGG